MKRGIVCAALCIGFLLCAFAQESGDFAYTAADGGITITGYNGSARTVVIPGSIDGLPVTAIGVKAFSEKRLTSVTFPDTVTVIGDRAFSYNKLSSVTLPPSVTSIAFMAFYNNRLKTITLPDSLTYIGDGAFSKNLLNRVVVPQSVRNFNSWAVDSYVDIIWK